MTGPIGPVLPNPVASKNQIVMRQTGNSGKKTSLFEDVSPGNVGNVFEISPDGETSAGAVASRGFNNGLASYGVPVRVLEVTGEDNLGEMLCISIQQESEIDQGFTQGTSPSFYPGGPMIGMVEFGAGAGLSFLEFDIPSPTITPGNVQFPDPAPGINPPLNISLPVYKRDNGALLTLPASSMRVLVRNDAKAPYLINPISARSGLNENNPLAARIRVHATYGRRTAQAKLTRTVPICNGSGGSESPTPGGLPFGGTLDSRTVRFGIPPFARRAWFPRTPLDTTSLNVTLVQFGLGRAAQVSGRGPIDIAAGSEGPIEIFPYDTVMNIENSTDDASVLDLVVVFELAI